MRRPARGQLDTEDTPLQADCQHGPDRRTPAETGPLLGPGLRLLPAVGGPLAAGDRRKHGLRSGAKRTRSCRRGGGRITAGAHRSGADRRFVTHRRGSRAGRARAAQSAGAFLSRTARGHSALPRGQRGVLPFCRGTPAVFHRADQAALGAGSHRFVIPSLGLDLPARHRPCFSQRFRFALGADRRIVRLPRHPPRGRTTRCGGKPFPQQRRDGAGLADHAVLFVVGRIGHPPARVVGRGHGSFAAARARDRSRPVRAGRMGLLLVLRRNSAGVSQLPMGRAALGGRIARGHLCSLASLSRPRIERTFAVGTHPCLVAALPPHI